MPSIKERQIKADIYIMDKIMQQELIQLVKINC